ncbi:cytochrome-c peroxidase [Pseudoalteromonas sp. SR41-4]|nr:cytochrome-c peroxidase [Pseudoalteromonas sp. SR41-4]
MTKARQLFIVFIVGLVFNLHAEPINFLQLRAQYEQTSENWPEPWLEEGVEHSEIGALTEVIFPFENPFTIAKMRLGEALFFDPILSRSGQIACASCHDPDLGWADGRRVSFGHDRQVGQRNAPSIENAALWQSLFWDGRARSLEQQALIPIQAGNEMSLTIYELELKLNSTYQYKQKFKQAFAKEYISAEDVAKALATFQRTIRSRKSDFDFFLLAAKQSDPKRKRVLSQKLTDQALWGMHLFRTKARCINCHSGSLFSDNKFHNIGLTYYKREYEDLGLFNYTGNPADVGKFKTPSLRGVMNTKPWMHNGLFISMAGVINIYNAGGVRILKDENDVFSPETSTLLKPLALTQDEKMALETFLHSITAHPANGPHFSFLSES